ncbi:hypothetical protein CK556_03740 [Mesoplasma chauliocola]|uniref:HU family DNA-binding protein n=2 Tax=Mesoplasma chauliocola TaxID=216427 RepID=A0A249SP91_9MOLU|nr:HU family DNA-binding protein [Mesoplasma chauliocola]ASZ09437.1 hypothetical protein CK556_03740 [Mesoplasma chauliocola]
MSIEMRNKKHTRTISLIILLILFIGLVLVFKIINQVTNGTSEWLTTIKATGLINEKYLDTAWFSGSKELSHFFNGPMGFKSFAQFKLIGVTGGEYNTFLLPIFWDLLINWIGLVGIIFLVIWIILSWVNENKINKILSEKGSTTAPVEVKQATEQEIKQEAVELEEKLEEELIVKNKKTSAIKKPAVKKETNIEAKKTESKPTTESKPVAKKTSGTKKPAVKKETNVEAKKTESKPVAKKTSGTKKPAVKKETNVEAKKVEEVKVVETKAALVGISKTESKYVIKKHYEQVSKKDLLVKLEEKHSDLSKKAVKKIVDSAFEIMSETLFKNEEIMISNFGKLEKIHKEQKQGKNPSTGEIITIPASNSVKFKANKHLKELMTKTKWTGLKRVKKEVKK